MLNEVKHLYCHKAIERNKMRNFNYQFVFNSIGLILMIESSFMLISAFVGEIYQSLPFVAFIYRR